MSSRWTPGGKKKQELDEFHPVSIMLCRLFSRFLDLQFLQPLVYVPRPNRVLAVLANKIIAPDYNFENPTFCTAHFVFVLV